MVDNISTHNNNKPHQKCKEKLIEIVYPGWPLIGNPYRNHKLLNIESTERYISRHCWNVATYKWKVHTGKIEIMSFVVKF
jgi:hypothetical protein